MISNDNNAAGRHGHGWYEGLGDGAEALNALSGNAGDGGQSP
jgi:hypothetical protein